MKANDEQFTKIINGCCQFVIPVFQRDYTWQAEPHCAQLWRDIIRVARTTEKHFIGSIVYIATGDTSAGFTRWLLIDGQQRLATLMILLAALRDHISDTRWRGGENDPTPSRIDAYFLKNVQEEGDREQKLVLRRHDQATLRSLLNKMELPRELSERIRENYKFFRDRGAQSAHASNRIAARAILHFPLFLTAILPVTLLRAGITNDRLIGHHTALQNHPCRGSRAYAFERTVSRLDRT